MLEEERFEELLVLLDELAEDNLHVPIVVEGKRDVASLRALGCAGDIWQLHSGEPLLDLAERFATRTREVILLTDWDRKGGILFDQLSALMTSQGIRVNGLYRERVRGWIREPIKDVESLASYVDRKLGVYHATTLRERVGEGGRAEP